MSPLDVEITEPVTLAWIQEVIGPLVMLVGGPLLLWLLSRRTRAAQREVIAASARMQAAAQQAEDAAAGAGGIRASVDVIQEHVANSHQTNLREDIDGVTAAIERVLKGQAAHARELDVIKRQQGRVYRRVAAVDEKHDGLSARLDEHIEQGERVTSALRAELDDVTEHITKGRE